MNEDDLLALDLAGEFEKLRKSKGTPYHYTDRDKAAFLKAAVLCKKMGLSPPEYMQTVGKHCKLLHPNTISPEWLIKAYTGSSEEVRRKASISELFKVYKQILKNQLTKRGVTLEYTLLNDDLPFPAWFRVSCTKENYPSVFSKYVVQARTLLDDETKTFIESENLNDSWI